MGCKERARESILLNLKIEEGKNSSPLEIFEGGRGGMIIVSV